MTAVVEARHLSRTYPGPMPVRALIDASLRVESGERVAVVGPSGSGKSTLLNLVGLLDRPTLGNLRVLGRDTTSLSRTALDELRRTSIGFVFQSFHVLGRRTVAENMLLRLAIAEAPARLRSELTQHALSVVGLDHLAKTPVHQLSGGEKQRLAIARAMVGKPRLILADEPTGNLDDDNASAILEHIENLAGTGIAVIVITHDLSVANWADRVVRLNAGVLADLGSSK